MYMLLLILLIVLPSPISAQEAEPLKELGLLFTCDTTKVPGTVILDVRDGPQPAFYQSGKPVLDKTGAPRMTNGMFHHLDGPRFKESLKTCLNKNKAITRIDFTSGGGDVAAAFEIAQTIADYRFHTHVPAGSRCVSACTLAFLGGSRRTVDPQGSYEVHGFTGYMGEGAKQFACQFLINLAQLPVIDPTKLRQDLQSEYGPILRVLNPNLQQIQAGIKGLAADEKAKAFLCDQLGSQVQGQLMEIERSSALLSRRWMQMVQQRKVSSKLLDHIFATTTAGVRPLSREELEELAVVTDDGK